MDCSADFLPLYLGLHPYIYPYSIISKEKCQGLKGILPNFTLFLANIGV